MSGGDVTVSADGVNALLAATATGGRRWCGSRVPAGDEALARDWGCGWPASPRWLRWS